MNIYLITGNQNKIKEAEQILGIKLKNKKIDLDEIQELDADKVAEHKVKQAYKIIREPVLVEDTSLYITCLNDFPGPLIKWFWPQVTLDSYCRKSLRKTVDFSPRF